jgi:hypothetical protein
LKAAIDFAAVTVRLNSLRKKSFLSESHTPQRLKAVFKIAVTAAVNRCATQNQFTVRD